MTTITKRGEPEGRQLYWAAPLPIITDYSDNSAPKPERQRLATDAILFTITECLEEKRHRTFPPWINSLLLLMRISPRILPGGRIHELQGRYYLNRTVYCNFG